MHAKVLATRTFKKQFQDCLARGPSALIIVSPFLTAYPPWRNVFHFCDFSLKRGISKITIVTRPPGSHVAALSKAEADLIEAVGVDLRIRATKLHSKFYFFVFEEPTYAAFVGSANFTQGGFLDNDETVAMLQHLDDRTTVQKEVDRLTTFGSFPYSSWKAASTKISAEGASP